MSVRLSTCAPRACSGDMYAAVPTINPALVVSAGLPAASRVLGTFASPKSRTFTVPSGVILMFAVPVLLKGRREQLQRALPPQLEIIGEIDLAHRPSADRPYDPEMTEHASCGGGFQSQPRGFADHGFDD